MRQSCYSSNKHKMKKSPPLVRNILLGTMISCPLLSVPKKFVITHYNKDFINSTHLEEYADVIKDDRSMVMDALFPIKSWNSFFRYIVKPLPLNGDPLPF